MTFQSVRVFSFISKPPISRCCFFILLFRFEENLLKIVAVFLWLKLFHFLPPRQSKQRLPEWIWLHCKNGRWMWKMTIRKIFKQTGPILICIDAELGVNERLAGMSHFAVRTETSARLAPTISSQIVFWLLPFQSWNVSSHSSHSSHSIISIECDS